MSRLVGAGTVFAVIPMDHNAVYLGVVALVFGITVALLTGYRNTRGFWPWDRKRHKIAIFGHLVDTDTDG